MMFDKINCYHIYLVIRKDTGKVEYSGQTGLFIHSTRDGPTPSGWIKRWKAHVSSAIRNAKGCTVLNNAIRKYGVDAFECVPYLTCRYEDRNTFEEAIIKEYNTVKPGGYNLKKGGNNHRHHEDTKVRISEAQKGKIITEECRLKISHAKKKLVLPDYILPYNDKNRKQFGYQVHSHPTIADRKFIGNNIDDKVKLQDAIDYLAGKEVPVYMNGYVHDDAWAAKVKATKAVSVTLPQYISLAHDRGAEGYAVRKHPTLPNRIITDTKLSMKEKLQVAIDYVAGKLPVKEPKVQGPRTRTDGLPEYVYPDGEGYRVKNHPTLKNKSISNNKVSKKERLQMAIDYVNSA